MKNSEVIREKIRDLLVKYPDFRNDDKKLWLAYLNVNFDLKKKMNYESYELFKKTILSDSTPSLGTITKLRRKVQEEESALAAPSKTK
mgnify:CR=1 FL=1